MQKYKKTASHNTIRKNKARTRHFELLIWIFLFIFALWITRNIIFLLYSLKENNFYTFTNNIKRWQI